jgi:hypothetical protein
MEGNFGRTDCMLARGWGPTDRFLIAATGAFLPKFWAEWLSSLQQEYN